MVDEKVSNPRSKLALHLLRQGAETLGVESAADKRKHLLMGFASQLFGIDPESGEPTLDYRPKIHLRLSKDGKIHPEYRGAIPGLVDSTLSAANLPAMIASAITGDNYKGPQFADEAQSRADRLDSALRGELGIGESADSGDTFNEALGMMAGQVPIPRGRVAKKILEAGKPGIEMAREIAHSPVEYFTPTITPSLSNYVGGAAFPAVLEELFPRLVELKNRYFSKEKKRD